MFAYSNNRPVALLSATDAAMRFPTLAASAPHDSRSERYQQVSTFDVLRSLESEGFGVANVQLARVRDETKHGYEKHIVRLRRFDAPTNAPEVLETVLLNSHDGSTSYELMAGIFRLVCTNGLMVGTRWAAFKVPHRGDIHGKVIDATYTVVEQHAAIADRIDAMKARVLTSDEVDSFATRAHALRFPAEDKAPVSPLALTYVRRSEDHAPTLWNVFNRVQENVMRGGLRGRRIGANGQMRRATVRAVTGIDQTVSLNRGLFDLADELIAA